MNENMAIRDSILSVLGKNPEGLTIAEITTFLSSNRVTISKYIYGLIIEGLIKQRQIGPAKLCYLCDKNAKNKR